MEQKRWKQINIILAICAVACLICYDLLGGVWLKGVTSSWFVLLGLLNLWVIRSQGWKNRKFPTLLVIGLILGMCADVLLQIVFLAGTGVFALGHLLYFAAFCSLESFRLRDLRFILPVALLSMFLVTGTPWITVEDPFLQNLLLAYAVIISAMVGKAISNAFSEPSGFRRLLAAASILFWFSDLILAVDLFGQSSRLTWILCSYSYWPSQTLLAHSLFYAKDACDR